MTGGQVRGPAAGISVFLSYPKPCHSRQQTFVSQVSDYLRSHGFEPRTLGVTDYDMDAPLKAIRRLMMESNGLITIAFRRMYIEKGTVNFSSDLLEERPIEGEYVTSPWAQIEPAMAYQIGLPVLIIRESGVVADGLLEKGVLGTYMPEVDLSGELDAYFGSAEWTQVIAKWEGYVRSVVDTKGSPPRLY